MKQTIHSLQEKIEILTSEFRVQLRELKESPYALEREEAYENLFKLIKTLEEFGYASEFWEIIECYNCFELERELSSAEHNLRRSTEFLETKKRELADRDLDIANLKELLDTYKKRLDELGQKVWSW